MLVRPILVALVGCALASILLAQEPAKPNLAVLRVAQLEDQVEELTARLQVCTAQNTVLSQAQRSQAMQQRHTAAEKAAGCAADWNQQPPVCKSDVKPKE